MIDYNFNGSGLFSFYYYIEPNSKTTSYSNLYSFIYVSKGFGNAYFEDKCLTAGEGQILFLPTDTNYKLVFTHPKNELCKGYFSTSDFLRVLIRGTIIRKLLIQVKSL